MQSRYRFTCAWLADGWHRNVVISVDPEGEIVDISADDTVTGVVVEPADPQDAVARLPVPEAAAERVAGVGRIRDELVVPERIGDLRPEVSETGQDLLLQAGIIEGRSTSRRSWTTR